MPEIREMPCPICHKGTLRAHYTPRTLVTHYARAASNKKAMNFYRDEKWQVISETCSTCGKPKKAINDFVKFGARPSHEDILARIRESGLPMRIGGAMKPEAI